ncbi:MAG: Ig-like domain-containing protein [Pirellulales bacterium]
MRFRFQRPTAPGKRGSAGRAPRSRGPNLSGQRRLVLGHEPLESRLVLTVTPTLSGAAPNFVVTFTDDNTGIVDNNLELRFDAATDELLWAVNGGSFSNDLDPAVGVQSATFADIAQIQIEMGLGTDAVQWNLQAFQFDATVVPDFVNPLQTDLELEDVVSAHAIEVQALGTDLLRFDGTDDDDTLIVNPGAGDHRLRVDNFNASYDRVTSDSLPEIRFQDMNTFRIAPSSGGSDVVTIVPASLAGATNYETELQDFDSLVIEGTATDDDFTVATTGSDVVVSGPGPDIQQLSTLLGRLEFQTQGGNDVVSVDVDGTSLVSVSIFFDGGTGRDELRVTGTPTTSVDEVIYSVGPGVSEGLLTYEDAADLRLMSIGFANLEPVVDLVPAATLTVNGTAADNAINYTTGSVAANGLVTVDNFESIEFSNKDELVINAGAGSDAINLNNPQVPTDLVNIVVNGFDPTASDTLVVNGTTAAETIAYAPDGVGSGDVTITALPDVSFSGIEHLVIDGQRGGDTLNVDTFFIDGTQVLTPAVATDAGRVDFQDNTFQDFLATALNFRNLGNAGLVAFADGTPGDGPIDNFVYRGSDQSDTFQVTRQSAITGRIVLNNRVAVDVADMINVSLLGLDGDDTFALNAASAGLPFTSLTVDGGNPSASDIVNLVDAAAAVVVNLADDIAATPTTVAGYGALVSLLGVEVANLDANGQALTFVGTVDDDVLTYIPTGSSAGIVKNAGLNTVFNFSEANSTFTISGGSGGAADQLIVQGTNSRDLFQIDQSTRQVQVLPLNFVALKLVTLDTTIDLLLATGVGGQDTFQVIPGAGIGNFPQDNLLVKVDGGGPGESNALVLAANFDGGNLPANHFVVINRDAAPSAGWLRVFQNTTANPDIQYENVQVISPHVAGSDLDPNLLIIGPDNNEPNEFQGNATFLGSGPSISVTGAIFPSSAEFPGVSSDIDFYRLVAHSTGILDLRLLFRTFAAGLLPGDGALALDIRDSLGDSIGTVLASPDGLRGVIPVVAGQSYFVRVAGANGSVVNGYSLLAENIAVPVPTSIVLDPLDDSGESNLDRVTFETTNVHFLVHADLTALAAAGITILTPAQATGGVTPGAAVEVFVNGVSAGFATVVAGTNNTLFEIDVSADLAKFAAGPLAAFGVTNLITAAVHIFDAQENGDGVADPVEGRGPQATPVQVLFDNLAPAASSTPDLLASSDSGTAADNTTNSNPPAFSGTGEANTKVRIFANGILVGQGIVGSDNTDGVPGNGVGLWEVTVEPLIDGNYSMIATLEDKAGNLSAASAGLNIVVDTLAPQRPTIDLIDSFDSGASNHDNITNRTQLDFLVSAEVGTMVAIKDGNTVIDSFVMPAVAFTTRTLNLANGPHPLSAEATDTAGNRSAQSEELLVIVDTVAPVEPSTPDLLASSDSGLPGDNNTNINQPAFVGTGEANAKVTIFANGLQIGQGVVGTDITDLVPDNGIGAWEVTVEPLIDGAYNVLAVVEDLAGNISLPSTILPMVVDTLPPQRPTIDLLDNYDTGSSNLDGVTYFQSLNFRVSALAGADVVIKDGETVIDSFVMPAGGFTTRTLNLTHGPHPLSVEATDTAGNRSAQAEELLITVDTVPPAPPSTPQLLDASDSGPLGDGATSVNPPAFKGTGEANAKVRIFARLVGDENIAELVGEGVVGSDLTDPPEDLPGEPPIGAWEVTIEPLAEGEYEIFAVLEDLAGNISEASGTFLLIIDTTAPQRPTIDLVNAFDTGSSDLDNVTYLTTLDFRVSAEPGTNVVIKDGNTVIDMFVMPAVPFTIRALDFVVLEGINGIPAAGPHPLSAEATDDAGNRSAQSEELLVHIDTIGPGGTVPDLLDSSDSGTLNTDDVTNIQALAFQGTAEANTKVRILANGVVVGEGIVGSDLTNPPPELPGDPPAIGHWEVTTEPLADGTYVITAEYEDLAGNINFTETSITVYVDTVLPNTPYLDLTDGSDTGRHNQDNVTRDNTPTVTSTIDDVQGGPTNAFPNDIRYRIYDRPGTGADVLLVDSFVIIPGFSTSKFFTDTLPLLADGVHNLKLEAEDRAGNVNDFLLEITIDTVAPPIFFGFGGDAEDGLDPNSDSGVEGVPATFVDRITNVTRPTFWGTAEANAIVRLFNTGFGAAFVFGEDVAIPLDGNFAFPDGRWDISMTIGLNDPGYFPFDGLRQMAVTAEDLAGNESDLETLDIFVDTQGPQVTDVHITGDPVFNLFGLKPENASQGPTPLITQLSINLQDLPNQDAAFLRDAIEEGVASSPGLYLLRGDHNGYIQIEEVEVELRPAIAGQPARATIVLTFGQPLPDDRYTLTVRDTLVDLAGNNLDGENDAIEPTGFPLFPTGDGQPGGDFIARFTVDSRPEIGTYASASIYVDINGNLIYDPQGVNNDQTNRDLTFGLGIVPSLQGVVSPFNVHDGVFVGNFPSQVRNGEENGEAVPAAALALVADGYDKLAAYGFDNLIGKFRWLIDTNHDGVIDPDDGDHATIQPNGFQINGLPVAGDFDGEPDNGDEIGLFDGTKWYFDTNHNYVIDGGDLTFTTSLRGAPIVGDFNGDGVEDLATWKNDVFYFDFGDQPGGMGTQPSWNGAIEATINWGLPGTADKPVAADMDQDGITDIGLFLPARTGVLPLESGNWQFLMSNDFDEELRGGHQVTALDHPFSPFPLGTDIFAQFGDEFALPIVGNLDPPVAQPNLASAQATQTILGSLPVGNHTINGDEWYSFTPLRDGTIVVQGQSTTPGSGIKAYVYDENYRLLSSTSATAHAVISLSASVAQGETYRLRLSGDNAQANVKVTNHVDALDRLDTSRDGIISPIDAMRVINALIRGGVHATPMSSSDAEMWCDTNMDGMISPIDAGQVINYLILHSAPAANPAAASAASTVDIASAAIAAPAIATPASASAAGAAVAFALSVDAGAPAAAPAVAPPAADALYAELAAEPAGATLVAGDPLWLDESTDAALVAVAEDDDSSTADFADDWWR